MPDSELSDLCEGRVCLPRVNRVNLIFRNAEFQKGINGAGRVPNEYSITTVKWLSWFPPVFPDVDDVRSWESLLLFDFHDPKQSS